MKSKWGTWFVVALVAGIGIVFESGFQISIATQWVDVMFGAALALIIHEPWGKKRKSLEESEKDND